MYDSCKNSFFCSKIDLKISSRDSKISYLEWPLIEKLHKIRFQSLFNCLRSMLTNKPLFNKLEDDSNLYDAYGLESINWTFILSLYKIVRKIRFEHLYYEKNYRFSAEKVISRLVKFLEWICEEEISNSSNDMYMRILKEPGIPGPWRTRFYVFDGPWILDRISMLQLYYIFSAARPLKMDETTLNRFYLQFI